MQVLSGTGVAAGIAEGRLAFYRRCSLPVRCVEIDDYRAEVKRLEDACFQAEAELLKLAAAAEKENRAAEAQVFQIYRMMLWDSGYYGTIKNTIVELRINAEYAVRLAESSFTAAFSSMDDPYMRARGADIYDISRRLVSLLLGIPERPPVFSEPTVLAVESLTPSEVARLDPLTVKGLAVRGGSPMSHASLLVKERGLPTVVRLGEALFGVHEGAPVLADGDAGRLYIQPDEAVRAVLWKKRASR